MLFFHFSYEEFHEQVVGCDRYEDDEWKEWARNDKYMRFMSRCLWVQLYICFPLVILFFCAAVIFKLATGLWI